MFLHLRIYFSLNPLLLTTYTQHTINQILPVTYPCPTIIISQVQLVHQLSWSPLGHKGIVHSQVHSGGVLDLVHSGGVLVLVHSGGVLVLVLSNLELCQIKHGLNIG